MLLIRSPLDTIFNNVAGFKTAMSYTGSILFFDVGGLYEDQDDMTGYIDNDDDSSFKGLNLHEIKGPLPTFDISNLPSHTEVDFATTRGFYIP